MSTGYNSMANDVIIVNHIKTVVEATNTALQEKGFNIPVYYDYGHLMEITKRLQELTQSPAHSHMKFPRVILFTDISVVHNTPGQYGEVSLHILIVNVTDKNFISPERTDKNFIPILHPIKRELINQLSLHTGFTWPVEITYTETDCYFYGSVINDKNAFNDYVDAIELKNVRIGLYDELCELTSNI